jgi:predicted dehydrogenase
MGDIGTHAAHLAEYITGLKITQICADLNILVEGRILDDDGGVLLKFENGAAGVLMASQVAAGEENGIKIGFLATQALRKLLNEKCVTTQVTHSPSAVNV